METITYKPRVYLFKAVISGTPFVLEGEVEGDKNTPSYVKLDRSYDGYTAVDLLNGELTEISDDIRVIPFDGHLIMYPYRHGQ